MFSLWLIILSALSLNGFFADFSKLPPRPVLALLIPLPFVLLFAFSKTGKALLNATPANWLIGFQTFRLLVEALLWLSFINKHLPKQMTFEGGNFDILTGVFALITIYYMSKKPSSYKNLILVFSFVHSTINKFLFDVIFE